MIYRRHDGVAVPIYEQVKKGDKVPVVKDGVLFCSDLHLGHKMAAEMRGFDDVNEHDESVVSMLEQQCSKRTILWVLGDVAMKPECLFELARIKGKKKLILGNHDVYDLDSYRSIFDEIHGFVRYKGMWISHCPIHESEFYRAKLNIHGHVHYMDRETKQPHMMLPLPYLNVNWDMWGRAVSLREILTVRG